MRKRKRERHMKRKRSEEEMQILQQNIILDHCYSVGDESTCKRKSIENAKTIEYMANKLRIVQTHSSLYKKEI
ncbi:Uncharacterized protein FKW44_011479, partial [Caligus rogercresseyi]